MERVKKNNKISKYNPPYTFTKFLSDNSRDEWRKDRYNQIANDSKVSSIKYVKRIIKSEDEAVSTRLIHRDNSEINKLRCGSSLKPLFGKDSNNIVGETTVLGVIDRLIDEKEKANNKADNSLERMLKRNPEYKTIKERIEEVKKLTSLEGVSDGDLLFCAENVQNRIMDKVRKNTLPYVIRFDYTQRMTRPINKLINIIKEIAVTNCGIGRPV